MGDVVQVDWNRRAKEEIKEQQGGKAADQVEELQIYNPVTDLALFAPFVRLQHLVIHQPTQAITRLRSLEGLPPLDELRTLALADHLLADLPADFAARYPKLQTLLLTNNKFYDIAALAPLHKSTSLVVVDLDDNPLVKKDPEYRNTLFAALPSLVAVDGRDRDGADLDEGDAEEDEEDEEGEEMEEGEEEEEDATAEAVAAAAQQAPSRKTKRDPNDDDEAGHARKIPKMSPK